MSGNANTAFELFIHFLVSSLSKLEYRGTLSEV